jgi:hypothetical protein
LSYFLSFGLVLIVAALVFAYSIPRFLPSSGWRSRIYETVVLSVLSAGAALIQIGLGKSLGDALLLLVLIFLPIYFIHRAVYRRRDRRGKCSPPDTLQSS